MNEDWQEDQDEPLIEDMRGQWIVVVLDFCIGLSLFACGFFVFAVFMAGNAFVEVLPFLAGSLAAAAIFGWMRWMLVFVREIANR